MIRRIREMLCLQAEPVTVLVNVPLLSRHAAIEKISRVELHSRLRRRNFQHPPAGRLIHPRRKNEASARCG